MPQPDDPTPKPARNRKLETARKELPSLSGAPGMCMTRRELAEAANTYVWEHTGGKQRTNMTEHDIGRYERAEVHWPDQWRRYGLRRVLGASSDRDLGFYPNRRVNGSWRSEGATVENPESSIEGAGADDDRDLSSLRDEVSGLGEPGDEVNRRTVPAAGGVIASSMFPTPFRERGEPGMAVEVAMEAFRSADRRLGGAYLYATVVDFLRTEIAPGVFGAGNAASADGRTEFAAAAALTEMAGWMAHDSGRDEDARRHMSRSLGLVRVADDRQLHTHVLASMAHLADDQGQPAEADRLSGEGLDRLREGAGDPDLEARLFALRARSAAARGEPDECVYLLGSAERSLGARRQELRSPWVNRFDEAALASETARCTLRLGDLGETQRQAERVIKLRPADQAPRSHAFAKLILISVLVARSEWEAACSLGHEVLDSTASLGSSRVLQQLAALEHRLEYAAGRTGLVDDFLDHLRPALQQRRWLQGRLSVAVSDVRGGR